jgi:beta-carotene hydroxylase
MTDLPESLQDNPEAFKALLLRPQIAWPTMALFAVTLGLYITSIAMGVTGRWPALASIAVNAVCGYWMFTVMHEASHNSLSLYRGLNEGVGRIATAVLFPLPVFRMFRYIHMQHHRFSNEKDDPDYWVGQGSFWALPLRCALMDVHYFFWYSSRASSRPKEEIRDTVLAVVGGIAVMAWLISSGWGMDVLLFWVLPSRIAIFFLALAFDYWPHSPYKATDAENKYIATSVRAGREWLLAPLLMSQNYHLVHHLYPLVPFYRYIKVWRARERFHLAKAPLIVTPGFKEMSTDDYLSLRGLS